MSTISRAPMLTVTLSIPPKELSPNARCHWRVKAMKTKAYRERSRVCGHVALLAAATVECGTFPRWSAASVQVRWFTKTATRPDADNALAHIKAGVDGLTDSGIFSNDRGLTYLPIIFAKDAKNPRLEITITPTK